MKLFCSAACGLTGEQSDMLYFLIIIRAQLQDFCFPGCSLFQAFPSEGCICLSRARGAGWLCQSGGWAGAVPALLASHLVGLAGCSMMDCTLHCALDGARLEQGSRCASPAAVSRTPSGGQGCSEECKPARLLPPVMRSQGRCRRGPDPPDSLRTGLCLRAYSDRQRHALQPFARGKE